MRKFLLLSAAACLAASASAGVTDVTPKGYDFDTTEAVPFLNGLAEAEWGNGVWNPTPYFISNHPELYKDGLAMILGEAANNYDVFINGTKIVDLGGEVGKVLCFGGAESNAQEALKARGIEIELPSYESNPGYIIPFWHADPTIDNSKVEGDVTNPCRIQIVLNIFENIPSGTATHFQPYIQMGGNWQPNDDNECACQIYSDEFCYNWGEAEAENNQIDWANVSDDDKALYSTQEGEYFEGLGDEKYGYVWNPNRWMVLEWDVPFGEGTDCPIKIKMEMPPLDGTTVFFKSIKFLMKDADEENITPQTRRRTWKYMTVDPSTNGINDVLAEAAAINVTVDGNNVTLTEAADVYTVTGTKVAAVAAGQTVSLANGFYVAASNGKSVKFVVK